MTDSLPPVSGSGPASTRSRRGRVLVIGAADDVPLPDEAQGRIAIRVPDVFCAIGELTHATANEPIEMVLISDDALNGIAGSAAAALQRVDPAVTVAMLEDNGGDSPAPPAEVLSDISRKPQQRGDAEPLERSEPEADPTPETARAAERLPPPPEPHATDSGNESAATIGDSDLLEAVLNSPDGVREPALTAIGQHTGWTDIALHEAAIEVDAAVPVTYAGASFGMLSSRAANTEELASWADWLGRWLALDASYRRHRDLAYRDELTDAMNRRYFNEFLAACLKDAAKHRRPVTLMVLDIDDFKVYNDTFGHVAGDDILRETVRLLTSVIRKGDRVCRIGGDEFAVIFADPEGPREAGSHHPENVEQIAQRFQDQICKMKFPKLGMDAPATLSVSAGLATYPWDGTTPDALLDHADQLALQSKQRGKNAITLGPGAQQMCRPKD